MRADIIAAFAITAASLQPGSGQGLTARQLFYQSDSEAKPPAPQPAAAVSQKSRAKKKTAAATAKSDAPAPAGSAVQSAAPASVTSAAPVSAPIGAPMQVTSAAYTAPRPLGLRYSIVQVANGAETEVSPTSTFHSGDMVRVKVEGNRDGYLYVIARGSSGTWKPLLPSPEINGGDNRIQTHRVYALPSGQQAFTFDEHAGEEQLFIIYSAEAVADIEGLIPSLPQPRKPEGLRPELTAMNTNPITDGFVSGLRNTYSRDLLVQTVEQTQTSGTSGDAKPENAVYVVNNSGGRLVADIRLEHR